MRGSDAQAVHVCRGPLFRDALVHDKHCHGSSIQEVFLVIGNDLRNRRIAGGGGLGIIVLHVLVPGFGDDIEFGRWGIATLLLLSPYRYWKHVITYWKSIVSGKSVSDSEDNCGCLR